MWRSAAESLARLPPRSGAGSPGAHPLVARVAPSTPLADGRDPIAPLYFEEALSDLKSELASGVPVFQSLLRTYLLDNTHRLLQPAVRGACRMSWGTLAAGAFTDVHGSTDMRSSTRAGSCLVARTERPS